MTLEAGTVAYWRDYEPGHDKFIYILGTNAAGDVLSFTNPTRTRWWRSQRAWRIAFPGPALFSASMRFGALRFLNSGIWSGADTSATVRHCPNLPVRSISGSRIPNCLTA